MASGRRFAGNFFGFTPQENTQEESESVLAGYFPELKLSAGINKGARGGRLGTKSANEQTTSAPAPTTPTSTPTPTSTSAPAYNFNLTDFTNLFDKLKPETQKPVVAPTVTKPEQVLKRSTLKFDPSNPSPKTPEEAVNYLYETNLGRTPSLMEAQFWLKDPGFADKSLTQEEWSSLNSNFKASPEYKSLDTYIDKPAAQAAAPSQSYTSPAPQATSPVQPPAVSQPEYVTERSLRNFTPTNSNPQTSEDAVNNLYQTNLGRTPSKEEAQYWLNTPEFADKGLTSDEWSSLTKSFQASPEYGRLNNLVAR